MTSPPAVPTTTLVLVRHGQSTWNAAGRWQGQADPPLSELGLRQAEAAAHRLGSHDAPPIQAVVTSDLERARRTAETLAAVLAVEVALEPRVRERHAGEWTGLTRAEIDDAWPGYLAEHRRPPGFETDELLTARILPGLADVAAAHPGGRVVVVTHGGVVRTLERHLGVAAPPLPNLGARELAVAGTAWRAGERRLLVDPDEVAVTVPRQI
jgi:probable phosphoglycerate mutase